MSYTPGRTGEGGNMNVKKEKKKKKKVVFLIQLARSGGSRRRRDIFSRVKQQPGINKSIGSLRSLFFFTDFAGSLRYLGTL